MSLLIGYLINKANLLIKAGWRENIEENRVKYQNYLLKRKENDTTEFDLKKAKDLSLADARMILITEGPEA